MVQLNNDYIIEMDHITKRYGSLLANNNMQLKLKRNEILALLGENGAGKSTLTSILFGLISPDEGTIKKDGKEVILRNANDATALNIGMVHQHFKLVEKFTVLQNIVLGSEPLKQFKLDGKCVWFKKIVNFLNKKVFQIIDYKTARNDIEEIIKKYNFKVDLDAEISTISVEMQQKTEILKMLYRKNEVLIFDEPTAVLAEQEIEEFLQILLNLKAEGKSIIFITHKLNEIMAVADRIQVIRKGEFVDVVEKSKTTDKILSELMVGRTIVTPQNSNSNIINEEVFRVENLTVYNKETKKNVVNNVSFNIRKGEILTIAGVDGNGQQELVYAISGLMKTSSGSVKLLGEDITNLSINKKYKAGLAIIPADRHKHGLVLDYTLEQNLILISFKDKKFSNYGFLKQNAISENATELIDKYDIRSNNANKSIARGMSGGNQQKIIIAREIERNTDFLIAVQPTRGLDVGAIENIHKRLLEFKNQGKAILLVSLELTEVLALSDRILVMYDGETVGEFDGKIADSKTLGLYMVGSKKDNFNAIKEVNNG